MRRYIEHIKESRDPHQRRLHAMRVAGGITAALFAVWLGTLSVRLTQDEVLANSPETSLSAAAAASENNKGPQLLVSTTSVLNY